MEKIYLPSLLFLNLTGLLLNMTSHPLILPYIQVFLS